MIKGEVVTLRGLIKEDEKLIYEWVNRSDLRDKMGTVYPISECEHEKWFEKMCCCNDPKMFAIEYESKCIGTIGLKEFDHINSTVELFVRIGDDSARNKGCGSDAVSTLVKYCFDHLNIHKVYLNVYASNVGAIRCYEKAGFSREGLLKEHHYINGEYEDVVVMGIINNGRQ